MNCVLGRACYGYARLPIPRLGATVPCPGVWGRRSLQYRRYWSEMRVPYKIYRDPLPPRRRSKYRFSQLEVCDGLLIPLSQVKSPTELASAAGEWAKMTGKNWKFATRVGDGCVGIWRVG